MMPPESNHRTSLNEGLSFSFKNLVGDDSLQRISHHVAPSPRPSELVSWKGQKKVNQVPIQIGIAEFISAKKSGLQVGKRIKNRLPSPTGKDPARKEPQPIGDAWRIVSP